MLQGSKNHHWASTRSISAAAVGFRTVISHFAFLIPSSDCRPRIHINFLGAYDDYKPSGAILPGESDGCAPGSQFDVEPKSVILSVPTSTFTPDPVPSTTAAPASTSAAPTTTSAAPVSTTTTRPAAAGRVGGSFVDKVVALAGAAAVVAALGA